MRDCFGDAALDSVRERIISCSGTSLATWEAALAYVGLIAGEVDGNACERNGVDQGMHNYFLYGGRLEEALRPLGAPPIRLVSNEEGWVATVQSMPTVKRDKGGRVLNDLGKAVAVVHQWDRSNALKEQYAREYTWLDDGELNRK